jgi:L-amino acid N-acyltransferase YncA
MTYHITPMQPVDWPTVREIYHEGIATGSATFETQLPDWEKWDSNHRKDCRIIARQGDQVLGWAALSPSRAAVSIRELRRSPSMWPLPHGAAAPARRFSKP